MEQLTSRKNKIIAHLRQLGKERAYRQERREFICDGHKLLTEALQSGAEVKTVLWREKPMFELPGNIETYTAPDSLFDYVSPMQNSPGPIFSLKMQPESDGLTGDRVIVLENVQDPGNVGTVVRTANALGYDAVVLVGDCADIHNPKTARATMGAIFRQRVLRTDASGLRAMLDSRGLRLCGAALTAKAKDLRDTELSGCAVAIGSEGRGLSAELLDMCDSQLIIPMQPGSESFNAAVAAAIVMWETVRA
ncbi:MAG: TrmH family RNA methyltransferase [Candidatus Heteroscillospira sp.]|jgi:TrmH family RNA methyltransferase